MIKYLTAFLVIIFISLKAISAQTPSKGKLLIKFTSVRNDLGLMAIGVNSSPEGWPRKPDLEYNWKKKEIRNGVFLAEISQLPFGNYAISVLDDENSNLEMDMLLGIPKEGYGFSNNPEVKLKPPSFETCMFRFQTSEMVITIDLHYVGKN